MKFAGIKITIQVIAYPICPIGAEQHKSINQKKN